MKTWIDKFGDIVWDSEEFFPSSLSYWDDYLHDGIRRELDDHENSLWMILE